MKMYNGIVLPALPGYNKSVYTHGFIQYGGVAGMEIYSLIVSTASGVMGDSYTVGEHTYSAWVVAANETAAENLSGAYPGISTKEWLQFEDGNTVTASTYDNIVWSDFDILKADGSVYLKASKPYDLESFKLGLSLGLCGNALPWKAEPVAWLYGHVAKEGETPTHTIDGVGYVGDVLQDIYTVYTPELQKTHPYVILFCLTLIVTRYVVLFSQTEPYYREGRVYVYGGNSKLYQDNGNRWGLNGEAENRSFYVSNIYNLWTAQDILYKDSTEIFLAASDCVCIPIYE